MEQETLQKELRIVNQRGLHARASAKLVRLVEAFDADVEITKDGQSVCGTSIMGLMMLAASKGSCITVRVSGPDAQSALTAISGLLEDGFGEED